MSHPTSLLVGVTSLPGAVEPLPGVSPVWLRLAKLRDQPHWALRRCLTGRWVTLAPGGGQPRQQRLPARGGEEHVASFHFCQYKPNLVPDGELRRGSAVEWSFLILCTSHSRCTVRWDLNPLLSKARGCRQGVIVGQRCGTATEPWGVERHRGTVRSCTASHCGLSECLTITSTSGLEAVWDGAVAVLQGRTGLRSGFNRDPGSAADPQHGRAVKPRRGCEPRRLLLRNACCCRTPHRGEKFISAASVFFF